MASTNLKSTKSHIVDNVRLAGGHGPRAAKQPAEMELRRLVMACLLWEDIAYSDGVSVVDSIKKNVHLLSSETVADIAIEARTQQKLRHVPLLLCRELARHKSLKPGLLVKTMAQVIRRPDEMGEFLSLYWKDNFDKEGKKRKTLSAQVRKGLALVFGKFDEYQLCKWDRDNKEVKLRDVIRLCHAQPKDDAQRELWKKLVTQTLPPAETWEVIVSGARETGMTKSQAWEKVIDLWVKDEQ